MAQVRDVVYTKIGKKYIAHLCADGLMVGTLSMKEEDWESRFEWFKPKINWISEEQYEAEKL